MRERVFQITIRIVYFMPKAPKNDEINRNYFPRMTSKCEPSIPYNIVVYGTCLFLTLTVS